jgi:hypothetical protein
MESFTLFSRFPVELQLAIWALAVPDPEPEVCIVWPLEIMHYADEEPALPFIVDMAWPAVAHVCRTARQAVLESGAVRLRYSENAGFAVPYRHFIPAIDTLYWGRDQAGAMHAFLLKPENAAFTRDLRHIAVEISATYPPSQLGDIIRQGAVFCRTLSLVLPSSAGEQSTSSSFLPPARRCRLRDVSGEALSEIKLTKVSFLEAHESTPMSLREYLAKRRRDLENYVRGYAMPGDGWSTRDGGFSRLEIKAQTFVEYSLGEHNRERWVEVCKDRLLGGQDLEDAAAPVPRRIAVAARKNPEEYRVLDDDSAWYSVEEYRQFLQRTNYTFHVEWYRNN